MTGYRELLCSLIFCHVSVTMTSLQRFASLSLKLDSRESSISSLHVKVPESQVHDTITVRN